jgi:hypothetical protein
LEKDPETIFDVHMGDGSIIKGITSKSITTMKLFNIVAYRQIQKVYPLMKDDDLIALINAATERGEKVVLHEEEKRGAEFKEMLTDYCRDYQNKSSGREIVKKGSAWLNEDGFHYFKLKGLQDHIKRVDKMNLTTYSQRGPCIEALNDIGAKRVWFYPGDNKDKGSRSIRAWCIADSRLDEDEGEVPLDEIPEKDV